MIVDYTPPMTEDVTVDFYLTFSTQEEADAILKALEERELIKALSQRIK